MRAVDFLSHAERRLREEGRLGLLSHVLTLAIAQHVELGSWDLAHAAEAEARQLARDTGQSLWNTGTMLLEAQTAGLAGDNEHAQALASEVEERRGAAGSGLCSPSYRSHTATASSARVATAKPSMLSYESSTPRTPAITPSNVPAA